MASVANSNSSQSNFETRIEQPQGILKVLFQRFFSSKNKQLNSRNYKTIGICS